MAESGLSPVDKPSAMCDTGPCHRLSGGDGRWAGRIAVLTMWAYSFTSVGLVKGLGIMLPTLRDQFETKTSVIGWITAMTVATSGLIGPFVGLLRRRFGSGGVIMACGVMFGVVSVVGSFTVTAFQLAFVYTPLAGAALGISCILSKEAVGRCFDKNHATAIGIARTGSSVGLIVCAPLVQLFLNSYGWRGTMMLLGGICSYMTVCGALMRASGSSKIKPRTNGYQEIGEDKPSSATSRPTNLLGRFCNSFVTDSDFKLLRSIRYWIAAVVYCNGKFAFDMWNVYFVSSAVSKGFSLEDAATVVVVAGVGGLAAKVAQGFIVVRGLMPCWALMGTALGISAASYCATPWLNSYWATMTSSLFILIAEGFTSCLNDVLAKQLLGVDLLTGAYGWMGIQTAISRFTLGFLPGLIYDNIGSFNGAFVFLGCVQASSLLLLLIARYMQLI